MTSDHLLRDDASIVALEFLVHGSHFEAARELERDSGLSSFGDLGDEINFLRDLVLDGDWKHVEQCLGLAHFKSIDISYVVYLARKQKLLELIAKDPPSSEKLLRHSFLTIRDMCVSNEEEVNQLKYCISQMNVRSQFPWWTVASGRYTCFHEMINQGGLWKFVPPGKTINNSLVKSSKTPMMYKLLGNAPTGLNGLYLNKKNPTFGNVRNIDFNQSYSFGQPMRQAPKTPSISFDILFDERLNNSIDPRDLPENIQNASNGINILTVDVENELDLNGDVKPAILQMNEEDNHPILEEQVHFLSDQLQILREQVETNQRQSPINESELQSQVEMLKRELVNMKILISDKNVQAEIVDPFQTFGFGDESLAPPPETNEIELVAKQELEAKRELVAKQIVTPVIDPIIEPKKVDSISAHQRPESFSELQKHRQWATEFKPCVNLYEGAAPVRCVAVHESGEIAIGTNSKSIAISAFPQDIQQICSSVKENSVLLYRPPWYEQRDAHVGSVYCLDWFDYQPGTSLIASGSNDKMVKLWTSNNGLQSMSSHREHHGTVRAVKFFCSPTGDVKLASIGVNNLLVWDVRRSKVDLKFNGHTGPIFDLAVTSTGQIVTGSEDGTVKLWETRSVQAVSSFKNHSKVHSVATSPVNEFTICSGHDDGTCVVWDLRKECPLFETHHHQADVRSMDFSADGSYILTGSFDGTIGLIDVDAFTRDTVTTFHGHSDKILQVKWHPSLPCFVSCSADNTVKGWAI